MWLARLCAACARSGLKEEWGEGWGAGAGGAGRRMKRRGQRREVRECVGEEEEEGEEEEQLGRNQRAFKLRGGCVKGGVKGGKNGFAWRGQ
eukprot:2423441-Rhodomonas_salina.1